MKIPSKYLSEIFKRISEEDESYKLSREIVLANSSEGNVWLIGGFVYGTLANFLYGTRRPAKDFDFIVENPNLEIVLPDSWTLCESRYKNPKFKSREMEIDFVPLARCHAIVKRNLPVTFDNYMKGNPLNIHSIAYNIKSEQVIGEVGISALEEKVVRVNDMEMAEDLARFYNTSINQIIRKKARELGFRAEFV